MSNGDVEDVRPTCPDCNSRMDCTGGDFDCTYYECRNCGYQYDECDEIGDNGMDILNDDDDDDLDDHFGELDPSHYHGS